MQIYPDVLGAYKKYQEDCMLFWHISGDEFKNIALHKSME